MHINANLKFKVFRNTHPHFEISLFPSIFLLLTAPFSRNFPSKTTSLFLLGILPKQTDEIPQGNQKRSWVYGSLGDIPLNFEKKSGCSILKGKTRVFSSKKVLKSPRMRVFNVSYYTELIFISQLFGSINSQYDIRVFTLNL